MYAIRVNKNTANQVQSKAHLACSDSDLIGFFIGDNQMIIKIQRPLNLINTCGAMYDETLLEKAMLWIAEKPIISRKKVFISHFYPAISVYKKKYHIHRLIMMYCLNRGLETSEYVHHKDGNSLNALFENLQIMMDKEHPVHHLKGRKQSPEFVKRRIAASVKAKRFNRIHTENQD